MKSRKIKLYSLDYLFYLNEVRLQESEQIEMGWMEEQDRASMSEIRRRENANKEFKETDERHQAEDQLGETRTILHRCEGH